METFSDFNSTTVQELKYNAAHGEMFVTFKNGHRYSYMGITPAKWGNLKSAKSVGRFIASDIKGRHHATKLDS